jgi:hypothetical protein
MVPRLLSMLLGATLMLAASWVEPRHSPAFLHDLVAGALVIACAAAAVRIPVVRFANTALSLWLFFSTNLFDRMAHFYVTIGIGILLFITSLMPTSEPEVALQRRQHEPSEPSVDAAGEPHATDVHPVALPAVYAAMLLGVWLFMSAFIWSDTDAARSNSWIVGLAIIAVAILGTRRVWWVNAALGLWTVISAFALPHTTPATQWSAVIVGLGVGIISIVAVALGGRRRPFPHHAHASSAAGR